MGKVLVIEYEKCTGCRNCEVVCSVIHEKVVNPSRARIKVIKWEDEGKYVPMSCQQCENAPCMSICPVKAISRDETLNRVMVDYDICIGCRMCVAICPFGAMNWDVRGDKVIKCDLCDGDPACVKFCDVQAVTYVEATDQSVTKRVDIADKFTRIAQKISVTIEE